MSHLLMKVVFSVRLCEFRSPLTLLKSVKSDTLNPPGLSKPMTRCELSRDQANLPVAARMIVGAGVGSSALRSQIATFPFLVEIAKRFPSGEKCRLPLMSAETLSVEVDAYSRARLVEGLMGPFCSNGPWSGGSGPARDHGLGP